MIYLLRRKCTCVGCDALCAHTNTSKTSPLATDGPHSGDRVC